MATPIQKRKGGRVPGEVFTGGGESVHEPQSPKTARGKYQNLSCDFAIAARLTNLARCYQGSSQASTPSELGQTAHTSPYPATTNHSHSRSMQYQVGFTRLGHRIEPLEVRYNGEIRWEADNLHPFGVEHQISQPFNQRTKPISRPISGSRETHSVALVASNQRIHSIHHQIVSTPHKSVLDP